MGFGRGWGMYGMHSFGGVIMMVLFWALVIIGIVYLVKNINNNSNIKSNNSNRRQEDNAIKIARERYARGEITKEELKEILDNL